MPLRGKIVVIKKNGEDGAEFPLTSTCLFGRTSQCDIRVQLPQVSKEHCRIDLNENKEVVLTNLSLVAPTRVNGELLQQSERLKHGDIITVFDRSFRFEYPPAPTPKKRSSQGGKPETLKVLQDQQVEDKEEKKVSEASTDPLKDGTNNSNIQQSSEKAVATESQEDGTSRQSKSSPFSDLYQMIKQSMEVKTPRKSSISLLQTPSSKLCTPKPVSVRKSEVKASIFSEDNAEKEDGGKVESSGIPQSAKKKRRSSQVCPTEQAGSRDEAASPRQRSLATPEKFSVSEATEEITQKPKSPVRRRSKEATPTKPSETKTQAKQLQTASPKNSTGRGDLKKRKSGELGTDLPTQQLKRKRVSFGGQLSPELFDKRLPPNSPLRKGAAPRRSLSLLRPKQSLLRRASVIGMLKEFDSPGKEKQSSASLKTPTPEKKIQKSKSSSPAMKSPKPSSPKAATPAKKSPKSAASSPKAATPAKKSPKSAASSPKAATPAKKSPKSAASSPKAATPAKKSPKSKASSPKAATPAKKSPKSVSSSPSAAAPLSQSPACGTPARNSEVQTPTLKGRFSVSRMATPSPVAEENNGVTQQVSSVAVTPKLRLKRKSMKSTSKKTPSISKNAIIVMQRRSGISRASMKVSNCWADIVKFGKPKAPVVSQSHAKITQKTTVVSKPRQKTPARRLKSHMSTGHADSPVTIVVGRAHQRTVNHPTGAAPRVITNIAVSKKNMKMDEDLSGISEMFKTPVNKKKRSLSNASNMETPAGSQATSVIDPSVLNTPEEPGEMIVSPMSVASAVKDRRYNSEAVQRLLNGDEELSVVDDMPALEAESEESDLKAASEKTPKQKPKTPECLTGVKRIMKTPRQKAEPVEDMRGKLLKTPKQKPEQQQCLTGVKRIMKTPRQRAEPIEDLRGKILKTPKQKPEQEECLSGVKRMMKTPKQKTEPLDDIRGKLLKTPRQKPEEEECLSAVKRVFSSPQQEAEPLEILKTPQASEAAGLSPDGGMEILETPAHVQVSQDLSEAMETPNTKVSPEECLTGIKRMMKTPKEKSAPVEDLVGVKRIMKTPKERGQPVEDNFGIKRLMKSPRPRGNAPVDDFEGLKELMEEPLAEPEEQQALPELAEELPSESSKQQLLPEPESQQEMNEDGDLKLVECGSDVIKEPELVAQNDEPSDVVDVSDLGVTKAMEAVDEQVVADMDEALPEAAADENLLPEQPSDDKVDETLQSQVEATAGQSAEVDATVADPVQEKKSVRGRRAKMVAAKEKEAPETGSPVVTRPVRGRRGVKAEAAALPAVTRRRNAKATESADAELVVDEAPGPSEVTLKPKRGRNAKQVGEVQAEVVPETEMEAESDQVEVEHAAAPPEKLPAKPKRGRKVKQAEQQDASPSDVTEEAEPNADKLVASQSEALTEAALEEEAETVRASAPKKSVRGRRGKQAEADEKQEKVEEPVRGRRGKKTEAAAPPAVRQTKRGRSAKIQENTSDKPLDETQPDSEKSEHVQPRSESTPEDVPSAEEAPVKPQRGRRPKRTPAEADPPESQQHDAAGEQHMTEAEPEQAVPPPAAAARPQRGRKTKAGVAEHSEATEDVTVTVETSQQPQPPVRSKRGRNARMEEEKMGDSTETAEPQEPLKRVRRTRKPGQKPTQPAEEVQSVEIVNTDEAEDEPAKPETVSEPAAAAAKPRRGQKAKEEAKSVSPEVQEAPAVLVTEKPKRGRRGKQATEEQEAASGNGDAEAAAIKPSRSRGTKTAAKSEPPQAVPAKRGRRGAARAEPEAEQAAAEEVTKKADPSQDSNTSKRTVKWKPELEVYEIPKATPVKAGRGQRSKVGDKSDTESRSVPKEAKRTEEDRSENSSGAPPVKRARGVKAADTSGQKEESTEILPRARRGRSAKK